MKKIKLLVIKSIKWLTTYKRCWGRKINEVHPYGASRWDAWAYRNSIIAEKIALAIFILGIGVGIGYAVAHGTGAKAEVTFLERELPIDKSDEIFKQKIDSLKDDVVSQLMKCESPGYSEEYGLVTYDPLQSNPNGTPAKRIPSYGQLQFKQTTVQHYVKLRDNKDITGKDAIILALNTQEAKELAKFIMFETKAKASGDWANCARDLNLDAQVDLIKKLEQK